MDVNDLLVGGGVDPNRVELLQLIADRDDDVGVVESEVDVVVPHEPERPDAVGVVVGHDTFAMEGVGHRDSELLREAHQGIGRAGTSRAVPGQYHWSHGLTQDVDGARHLAGSRRVSANNVARQRSQIVIGFVGIDVLWHRKIDCRRAFGLGELERFADHLRYRLRSGDTGGPPGDRCEHRNQVDVLVRLLVLPVLAHLGRDRDQRRAVGGRIRDTQLHVDRAWAQRRGDNGCTAGDPAVHLGHERCRLLVTGQHIPDLGRGQRLHEADVLLARQPEDHLDALVFQALDDQLGSFAHPSPPAISDRVNVAERSADSSSGCSEWLRRYSGPISGPEPCLAAAIDAQ